MGRLWKKKEVRILKGNIVYSRNKDELEICEHSYLVCADRKVDGIYQTLPFRLGGNPIRDCGDCLIIPGLTDLHIHAPQYSFRGMAMDLELLDWLDAYTFPEEMKYGEMEYAGKAYSIFAENMKKSAVTRASVFSTIHRPATMMLMDKLEKTGLVTLVGKVNMDRNAPEGLREETEESLAETEIWLEEVRSRDYRNTGPILTPRFVPSCTDRLLEGLGELQKNMLCRRSPICLRIQMRSDGWASCVPGRDFTETFMTASGFSAENVRQSWHTASTAQRKRYSE